MQLETVQNVYDKKLAEYGLIMAQIYKKIPLKWNLAKWVSGLSL